MKLTSLDLERFCAFKRTSLAFSPGINVLIGANGTGKSHLMKLLYSILKANEKAEKNDPHSPNTLTTLLAQKLVAVFRPDSMRPEEAPKDELGGLGRLVFRKKGRNSGHVKLASDAGKLQFTLTSLGRLKNLEDALPSGGAALFIPSREALAMYEGFVGNYEKRVLSFDETYYDICVALSSSPVRGPWPKEFSGLNTELETELGGRVHEAGGRFYVYSSDGVIEAHLLAEGLRKLASLFRLLQNQSLTSNGFLFWDEPEANLNPRLVTLISRILRRLANAGVQVFVTTHDYLLSSELSLAAEYARQSPEDLRCEIRFFCASRSAGGGVEIESAATLPQLSGNPILKEFAAHYDREQSLFKGQ
jgi:ABC-type hemin transport system ATPase subunit